MHLNKFIILLTISFLFISCASMQTQKQQYQGIKEKIINNDYAAAISQIKAAKEKFYKEKDRVVYYLDLGMLYHYNKQYQKSNEMLTKAEEAIDYLFTKSVSKAATSLLLNDNALAYSGEDYEDIYLNIFKALNYLEMNEFDAAFVEIRKINNKLTKLSTKYTKLAHQFSKAEKAKTDFEAGENEFHNSALGRYLSLLMYRTENQWDDVRIDYNKIKEAWNLQKHIYDFSKPDLKKAIQKTDKARLNLISFIGRSPSKRSKTLYIHTEKDLLIIAATKENPREKRNLEELDVINWKGIEKGYHFKFQLPFIYLNGSKAKKIKVYVDGKFTQELDLIESLEKVAVETFKVKKPLIYLKTISRSVIKGLVSENAKSKMENQINNPLLGFAARLATDAAVDATENADLRISRFFPAKCYIGEIYLQPGTYNLKIEYIGKNGSVINTEFKNNVEVNNNKLNLLETFYLQ